MFDNAIKFLKEVRGEMVKVTWPTKDEIVSATTIVIVSTLMLSFYLGVVDYILVQGVQPTLTTGPNVWSYVTLGGLLGLLGWVYRIIEK